MNATLFFLALSLLTGCGADQPAQSGDLKHIMVDLGEQMHTVQTGLWAEDFDAIAAGARAVADHPHVSPEELKRIQGALGSDFASFAAADHLVHDGAVRLTEAAGSRDLDATLREVASLQDGCVACHTQFRVRLQP